MYSRMLTWAQQQSHGSVSASKVLLINNEKRGFRLGADLRGILNGGQQGRGAMGGDWEEKGSEIEGKLWTSRTSN